MTTLEIADEIIRRTGLPYSKKDKYVVKCVFHSPDKHPSMSIDKTFGSSGYMKCWSCGEGKTLSTYYYEMFGRSINKDLNLKKDLIPINPIRYSSPNFEDAPETDFEFNGQPPVIAYQSRKGLTWLESRGFNKIDADRFNIKYINWGFTHNKKSPKNKEDWTYIYNRVVLPIYEKGKMICFEARDVDGIDKYLKHLEAKNLNIEDHPYKKVLYPKLGSTNTLYRIDHLDTSKRLYLVEGIIDVISLQKSPELINSTALFRNLASERQLYLLSKFPEIVIIPNNDIPSYIGASKIYDSLGNKIKILKVPSGVNDINDIIQGKHPSIKTIESLLNNGWLNKIQKATPLLLKSNIELLQAN